MPGAPADRIARARFRSTRRILWLGLALLVPLPVMLAVATGLMPWARLMLLAGIVGLVIGVEGAQGAAPQLLALLGIQAVLYALLLGGIAHGLARALTGLAPRRAAAVALLLAVLGAGLAASGPWYRTPFRAASTQASLLEIFE